MNKTLKIIGTIVTGAIILILLDSYQGITTVIDFELFWRLGLGVLLILTAAETRLKILGLFLFYYMIITLYLGFGCIQIKESNNGVEIYSPLGRKIDQAERLDTVYLRNELYDEYGDISTRRKKYYFFHSKDTVKIYNRLRMVISLKGKFSIIQQQQSRDVDIDLIKDADGIVYSLDGDIVGEDWKPRRIAIIPLDHNNTW